MSPRDSADPSTSGGGGGGGQIVVTADVNVDPATYEDLTNDVESKSFVLIDGNVFVIRDSAAADMASSDDRTSSPISQQPMPSSIENTAANLQIDDNDDAALSKTTATVAAIAVAAATAAAFPNIENNQGIDLTSVEATVSPSSSSSVPINADDKSVAVSFNASGLQQAQAAEKSAADSSAKDFRRKSYPPVGVSTTDGVSGGTEASVTTKTAAGTPTRTTSKSVCYGAATKALLSSVPRLKMKETAKLTKRVLEKFEAENSNNVIYRQYRQLLTDDVIAYLNETKAWNFDIIQVEKLTSGR